MPRPLHRLGLLVDPRTMIIDSIDRRRCRGLSGSLSFRKPVNFEDFSRLTTDNAASTFPIPLIPTCRSLFPLF